MTPLSTDVKGLSQGFQVRIELAGVSPKLGSFSAVDRLRCSGSSTGMPRKLRIEYPGAMYRKRYIAAPEHRPGWIRVDRLLAEHGIQEDTPAGRQHFEQRMEARRREETDPEALKARQRGWCLGSPAFRREMLFKMEDNLGEHHSGELHLEAAPARAERIIAQELERHGWNGRRKI